MLKRIKSALALLCLFVALPFSVLAFIVTAIALEVAALLKRRSS